ncbi:cupin domain-containing protein [Metallumcola ferriviriculae]|uniref:Cupin domain-containing protein n=1 Tax=Metallumcola ferriviriculae TaxID=3039180 RepID=A0AAU0UR27_9FIRM|nr:cupin domain-containing protein [Desulfitibacteraceae bacterium MK1]
MSFWIYEGDVTVYEPNGHDDTRNRRLVDGKAGIKSFELVIGEMGPQGYASAHAHQAAEQAMYIIEGELRVRIADEEALMAAGTAISIPKGAVHEVWNNGEYAKFVVVYSPPKN